MSDLLRIVAESGATVEIAVENDAGQWYNTVTPGFEAYDNGNLADYMIAASERGTSGSYTVTFPAVAAGQYGVHVYVDEGPRGAFGRVWDGSDIVWTAIPGDEMVLTSAYDAAKSAAQAGNEMALTSAYDAAKSAAQAGDEMALTSAYDAAKTAAQAGDEMALTSAYDAAKTAAQAGDEMDLVDAPNGTAVTAIQSGLSTLDAAGLRTAVGLASANIDTQFSDIPAAVWANTTRTLSSFGTLVADVATAVWSATTRTLSAFGFSVTASSVTDKSGYSLTVTPPTAAQIRTELEGAGTKLTETHATVTTNLDAKVSEIEVDVNPESIVAAMEAPDTKLTQTHSTVMLNLDAQISSIGGAVGPGDIWYPIKITVNGLPTGRPVPDADVWITTDQAGQFVVAGKLQTKADGIAWFQLEHSVNYYAFAQKSGHTFMQAVTFKLTQGIDYGNPVDGA